MKVVYCTNIWNHHQGPVCRELAKILGDDFKMILHQPLDHKYSKERLALGWNLNPPEESWILRAPGSCRCLNYREHVRAFMDADVVIYNGGIPYVTQDMLVARVRSGKINMRMGERLYRGGIPFWNRISLRKQIGRLISHWRLERAKIHFLTMSHWCVEDLAYLHACKGRTWRWGYLTPMSEVEPRKPVREKIIIGWCGRMLYLKQVDYIIRAFAALPKGVQERCEVRLAGEGEAKMSLVSLAQELGVVDKIHFSPFMTQAEAIDFLGDLDIFVFPSNRHEGWGATLLEAMNQGCAVIANASAGATLDVVVDGINGYAFEDGDVRLLTSRLSELILDDDKRLSFGREAWQTTLGWSPRAGADRLVRLLFRLKGLSNQAYAEDGLCSNVR